jgi:hypothetical protein
MRLTLIRSICLALALAVTGCAGTYTTTATVGPDPYGPDLVYAAPGVQVIADYNEPIFYADGFYWRYSGNAWYRSTYYTGGWAFAPPPPVILRINRPYAYVHYRPQGWTPRPYRGPGPRPVPAPARGWSGQPSAPPPRGGWRGAPTPQPAPAPAAVAPRGWGGQPSAPPRPPAAAPPSNRGGGGWRGAPRH